MQQITLTKVLVLTEYSIPLIPGSLVLHYMEIPIKYITVS